MLIDQSFGDMSFVLHSPRLGGGGMVASTPIIANIYVGTARAKRDILTYVGDRCHAIRACLHVRHERGNTRVRCLRARLCAVCFTCLRACMYVCKLVGGEGGRHTYMQCMLCMARFSACMYV